MSDFLKNGAAWLAGKMASHAATTIVYSRGADSVTITETTVGKTMFRISDPHSFAIIYERSRDYKFAAADLVLAGSEVLPEIGDEIRETQGDTTYVYVVTSLNGEPPFRWADKYRSRLRVHTLETGTE